MHQHERAARPDAGRRLGRQIPQPTADVNLASVHGNDPTLRPMLTVASIGMFAYGAYSVVWAIVDLLRGARLELWAELGLMLFGLLLALSAAFVRVRLPGGLAFAIGALLGLQALAVDIDGGVTPWMIRPRRRGAGAGGARLGRRPGYRVRSILTSAARTRFWSSGT